LRNYISQQTISQRKQHQICQIYEIYDEAQAVHQKAENHHLKAKQMLSLSRR
jgi:hypothetical protein